MIQARFRKLVPPAIALFAISLLSLAFAAAASAAEKLYWDNYDGGSIAYSGIDGSGGGQLNNNGTEVNNPEGMTVDSAAGRLYWSSPGTDGHGAIFFANLDNSGGAGQLNTAGAPVDFPEGVAVDPNTETIYWANTGEESEGDKGSIAWARLDGSAGGQLNTGGAPVESPDAIALDLAGGRIYWANTGEEEGIAYARLDGSGGGELDTTGAPTDEGVSGMAINPAAGRLYWSEFDSEAISYASLNGGDGGSLESEAATVNEPYGIAFDPMTNRIYIGNYHNEEEREGAISFLNGGSGGGNLTLAPPAPVSGPQDPVILRGPSAVAPPTIGGSAVNGSVLTCSKGTWAADYAGSYTYQAPHTYAYQWTLNGVPIGGTNAPTLAATQGGSYACTVTAANAAGSATQASAPYAVAGGVKLKKVQLNKKKGIATIVARISAPGLVALNGKAVVKRQVQAKTEGIVKLVVKAKGKAKKALGRKGKAKVAATVRFTVLGGPAAAVSKKITLKKTKKHGHR